MLLWFQVIFAQHQIQASGQSERKFKLSKSAWHKITKCQQRVLFYLITIWFFAIMSSEVWKGCFAPKLWLSATSDGCEWSDLVGMCWLGQVQWWWHSRGPEGPFAPLRGAPRDRPWLWRFARGTVEVYPRDGASGPNVTSWVRTGTTCGLCLSTAAPGFS